MLRTLALTLILATPAQADVPGTLSQIGQDYAGFAAAATTLADAAAQTCDAAALQPAFNAAFDAWMAVAHLRLGPVEQDGRALAIAFWPDPKALGAKAQRWLLTGDPAMLEPETFAQQSVAARGLMGLERLLYPAEAPPADPCPLIRATADNLARMAAEVARDWPAFAQVIATAGQPGNSVYLTEAEGKQALFTQLATGIEALAEGRIGRPLGTFDKPRPERAEARASSRSLRNIGLSVAALRDMALALDANIPITTAAFDRAARLVAALDDPKLAGIAEPQGWLKVEILQQSVRAARDAVVAELAPALGVGLGFNAQDGD
ncbi:MAG: imelysin family protein [Pseudomonadota bacterium]